MGLMGYQLKGHMASHVVTFFLFQNCCLWLKKMVNYLSSYNTPERKEPSLLNMFILQCQIFLYYILFLFAKINYLYFYYF